MALVAYVRNVAGLAAETSHGLASGLNQHIHEADRIARTDGTMAQGGRRVGAHSRAPAMALSGGLWPDFADALAQLTAITQLTPEALLHIGDTVDDVAENLALLLQSSASPVALGPARDRLIAAFLQGWQQELQKYDIRRRVGAVPIAGTQQESMIATGTNRVHRASGSRPYEQKATQSPDALKPPVHSVSVVLSQADRDELALEKLIGEVIATAPSLFSEARIESGFFTEFGSVQPSELKALIRPLFLKRKDGGTLTPQGAAKCWRGLINFLQFLDEGEVEPTNKVDLCRYFKAKRDQARKHRRSAGTGVQASKTAYSHLDWANRVFRLNLPLADELVRSHAAGIGAGRKVLAGPFDGGIRSNSIAVK